MSSITTTQLFIMLANRLPMLLILSAGVVLALLRYRRAPKAMRCIAVGCGIMLMVAIASLMVHLRLTMSPTSSLRNYLAIIALGSSLLQPIGLALVLVGAFAREPQSAFPVVMEQSGGAP